MYKRTCLYCDLPNFDHSYHCPYCYNLLPKLTQKLPPLPGEESIWWRIRNIPLAIWFSSRCKEQPLLALVPSVIMYCIASVFSFILTYYTPLLKMKQLHDILVFFETSNTSGGLVMGGAITVAVLVFVLLHIIFLFLMEEHINWQIVMSLLVKFLHWEERATEEATDRMDEIHPLLGEFTDVYMCTLFGMLPSAISISFVSIPFLALTYRIPILSLWISWETVLPFLEFTVGIYVAFPFAFAVVLFCLGCLANLSSK